MGPFFQEVFQKVVFVPSVWGTFSLIYVYGECYRIVLQGIANKSENSGEVLIHSVALHIIFNGYGKVVANVGHGERGPHCVDNDMQGWVLLGVCPPRFMKGFNRVWVGPADARRGGVVWVVINRLHCSRFLLSFDRY